MFPYFPSGVSNQRAADGNGYFLPVNWQTYTGNGSFSVQADCVPSSCNNLTADVIRSRRCVVGRPAGRRAGIYNDSDYVEIILEKNLGGIYAGKDYYNQQTVWKRRTQYWK